MTVTTPEPHPSTTPPTDMSSNGQKPASEGAAAASTAPQGAAPAVLGGSLTVLVGALIALATVFKWVTWTPEQTTLVSVEAGALIALVAALFAHRRQTTRPEPVALGATFTAAVTSTLAVGNALHWWNPWSEAQTGTVVALVSAIVGVVLALVTRYKVVPIEPKPTLAQLTTVATSTGQTTH